MFLILEYLVLFGPALLLAAVGLAALPLGLMLSVQGMPLAGLPVLGIELCALAGLYACFQLVRIKLNQSTQISKPIVIHVFLFLGILAIISFGLMGAFYSIGWHLYFIVAPLIGMAHLVYINRCYLYGVHS